MVRFGSRHRDYSNIDDWERERRAFDRAKRHKALRDDLFHRLDADLKATRSIEDFDKRMDARAKAYEKHDREKKAEDERYEKELNEHRDYVLALSEEAKSMLRAGKGYRCESYAGGGSSIASEVMRFEVEELGNASMASEACKALGLRGKASDCDTEGILDEAIVEIEKIFGPRAKVLWLGLEEDIKDHYCGEDEEPDEHKIEDDWLVISDIGPDGALFLKPSDGVKEKIKALVKRQRG